MEQKPLKTFIIYARTDAEFKQHLVLHLRPLVTSRLLQVWHDGDIRPGEDWEKSIKQELKTSDLVLVLVSVHSLNSEFIQTEELRTALARLDAGLTRVVPVVVSPCAWKYDPVIRRLQALPLAGDEGVRPVSEWKNSHLAWAGVVEQIGDMAQELQDKHAATARLQVETEQREKEEHARRDAAAEQERRSEYARREQEIAARQTREAQARQERAETERKKQIQTAHDNAWQRAQAEHDITGYEQFLTEYPDSPSARVAQRLIKALCKREQPLLRWRRFAGYGGGVLVVGMVVWLALQVVTNTTNPLNPPDSSDPYPPMAADNVNTKATITTSQNIPVDKPDEDKAWDTAKQNGGSESSFHKYRKDFPNGKYRDEALTQIGVIKAKDDAAVKELSNDLKNAETDCQLQYDAYNRYVNRKPAAHYTRMQSMANKKTKELAKTCGIVSQSGELVGKEGELRLTYINKEIKDLKEITLKIKQKGMELQAGKDILVDQLSSTESGQFEWILSELEGGETEVTVTAKAKATVGYYLMPDRPQRVRYVDGKIRITGGTPPLYMRIIRNGQLQPGKLKLDSRIIDFETSDLFKEGGKYHIIVLDYTDAKMSELKYPELPRKGQDFALLNLAMALLLTAIAAVTIFWLREDIKNWMRIKPS